MADTGGGGASEASGTEDVACGLPASVTHPDASAPATAIQGSIPYPQPPAFGSHHPTGQAANNSDLETLNHFLYLIGADAFNAFNNRPQSGQGGPTVHESDPYTLLRRDTFLLPSTSSASSQVQNPAAAAHGISRNQSISCRDERCHPSRDRIPDLFNQFSTPRHGQRGNGYSRRGRRKLLYSSRTPSPGKAPERVQTQLCTLARADSSHFPAPDFARSSSYAVSTASPAGASTLKFSPDRYRRSVGPSPPQLPTRSVAFPQHQAHLAGAWRGEPPPASYRFLPSDGSSLMGQHISSSDDHYNIAASVAESEEVLSHGCTPANVGGGQTGLTSGLRGALDDDRNGEQVDGAVEPRFSRSYRYATPPSPSPKRLLAQGKALRLVARQQTHDRGDVDNLPKSRTSVRKRRPSRKLSTGHTALEENNDRKQLKTVHRNECASQLQAEGAPISSNMAAAILCNLYHTAGNEVVMTNGERSAPSARSRRAEQRAQVHQRSAEAAEKPVTHRTAGRRRGCEEALGSDADADESGPVALAVDTSDVRTSGLAIPTEEEGSAAGRTMAQGPDEKHCDSQHRIFPRHIDKQLRRFPGLYERYSVPSHLPEEFRQKVFPLGAKDASLSPALKAVAERSFFRLAGDLNLSFSDPFDLYIPRVTRGRGMKKEALCPICYDASPLGRGHTSANWYQTKVSAYNYHLQITHGIMPATGQPMDPPVGFRSVDRGGNAVATGERKTILQGECHACGKWIPLESVKDVEVKIPEIYWRKHAAKCHKKRPMAGTRGIFVEDEFYFRVKAACEAEAE